MTDIPNYDRAKLEKITAALAAWQAADESQLSGPHADADALEGAFTEHGLQILPTVSRGALYRVLVDGQPAPYVGQRRPAGPVDANDAVEIFLAAVAAADEAGGNHEVTIRPATDAEQVADFAAGVLGGVL